MALLREVGSTTDDVVLSLLNLMDKGGAFRIAHDLYTVAHSHRVGAAYSFQPEVTLHFALHGRSVVGLDQIPTAGVLND